MRLLLNSCLKIERLFFGGFRYINLTFWWVSLRSTHPTLKIINIIMFIRYAFQAIFLAVLLINTPVMAYQDCNRASVLNNQVLDLPNERAYYTQQKRLLNQALQLCPNHPESHNNLADIFEREQNYPQAIYHYRQALKARPNFSNAWYGLGETYYKQGQFPLSLEAHLHACQTDKDSKARIVKLLKNNQYAVTEEGEIINKESLLVLYDKQRRSSMETMMFACGFKAGLVTNKQIFRNFQFDTGKATLKWGSERQLEEIAAALRQINSVVIKIHGHTDIQGFSGKPKAESDRLNLLLSEDRAASVAQALAQRGVSKTRMKTQGYGYSKPASGRHLSKNRRVEIGVE
jgi:outer membrane protein OmpA-like peptidoglycan-associated protein